MKKIIVWGILMMLSALSLIAGPAYPGRMVYTQPDGTTIGVYLHGDEYCHWMTDDSGRVVVGDADGYVRPANASVLTALQMKKEEASILRARNMEALMAAPRNNFGSPKIPVLLIGFKDYPITHTQQEFDAMLNQPGYSDNGAIGSVYDYYNENSFGAFTPTFEVLEPVNLNTTLETYGNDINDTYKALIAACDELNDSVDFSPYDNDGDGVVDFIIFYFAGFDEAQCPDAAAYTKFIWSHAWDVSSLHKNYDGVTLGKYFCTSELKRYSDTDYTMCSIGTTCHEFAHTLGLPDFYDVRYQEGASNTQAANMYDFDLMAGGSYNGSMTTPPYLNAEELMEIGWLDAIPEITDNGAYSLASLNEPGASQYSAYMTRSKAANEYFVYETRGGRRWDRYLPTGLLVYHVDKSTNKVSGSITAGSVWSQNYVNSYASHPCCYVVPAAAPEQTTYYSGANSSSGMKGMVFGTTYNAYSPVAWSGEQTGFQLSSITYSAGVTTFTVVNSNTLGIAGYVKDTDGNPLSDVTITVVPGQGVSPVQRKVEGPFKAFARKLFLSSKRKNAATRATEVITVTTDAEGYYLVETATAGTFEVMASKEGYVSRTVAVTVTSLVETLNFVLMREGEEAPSELYAWPTDILTEDDEYIMGSSSDALTGQNLYPASELTRHIGKQIKSITFYLYGDESTTYEGLNVIVDFDNERKATVPVSADDLTVGGYTTVDLRDQELIISPNRDIYAGVGYSSGGYYYNGGYYSFAGFFKTDEDENFYDWAVGWPYSGFVSDYNLTATDARYDWDVIFDFTLSIGDYEGPDMGYNYIDDPKSGNYSAGDVFPLNLVLTEGERKPAGTVEWYFDDEPVSGTALTLPSGSHVVEARFTTAAGNRKVVELEINVN